MVLWCFSGILVCVSTKLRLYQFYCPDYITITPLPPKKPQQKQQQTKQFITSKYFLSIPNLIAVTGNSTLSNNTHFVL